MTTLLSFDTSTKETGFAKYINGKLVDYGVVKNDEKNSAKRLGEMMLSIYNIIDEDKPDIVVTELTSVQRNAQVQRYLTLILGAVQGKCVKDDIFYYSYRPTEWRKLISTEKKPRKREELKKWGMDKVKELFNLELNNDNITDAILVGRAYINDFS